MNINTIIEDQISLCQITESFAESVKKNVFKAVGDYARTYLKGQGYMIPASLAVSAASGAGAYMSTKGAFAGDRKKVIAGTAITAASYAVALAISLKAAHKGVQNLREAGIIR